MPIDRSRSEKFISRALVNYTQQIAERARCFSRGSASKLDSSAFRYLPVGKTCLMWGSRDTIVCEVHFFLFFFFPRLCFSFFLCRKAHTSSLQHKFLPTSRALDCIGARAAHGKFRKWNKIQRRAALFHLQSLILQYSFLLSHSTLTSAKHNNMLTTLSKRSK